MPVPGPGTLVFMTVDHVEVAALTFSKPAFGPAVDGQAVARACTHKCVGDVRFRGKSGHHGLSGSCPLLTLIGSRAVQFVVMHNAAPTHRAWYSVMVLGQGNKSHEAAGIHLASRRRSSSLAAGRTSANGHQPTIGLLGTDQLAWSPWTAAFVERLRELGWIEGHTDSIKYRWTEGRAERVGQIAAWTH